MDTQRRRVWRKPEMIVVVQGGLEENAVLIVCKTISASSAAVSFDGTCTADPSCGNCFGPI